MAPPDRKKRPRKNTFRCGDAVASWIQVLTAPAETPASTSSPNIRSSSGSTTRVATVLTDAAVQALVVCHEHYLQILAAELASKQETESRSVVSKAEVEAALKQLGWEDLIPPAVVASVAASAAARPPPPQQSLGRSKKKMKHAIWTADMEAEQERLLAASKNRALGGKDC